MSRIDFAVSASGQGCAIHPVSVECEDWLDRYAHQSRLRDCYVVRREIVARLIAEGMTGIVADD